MDLNCIIFPFPSNSNMTHLKHRILLIPKNEESAGITYEQYLTQQTNCRIIPVQTLLRDYHTQSKETITTEVGLDTSPTLDSPRYGGDSTHGIQYGAKQISTYSTLQTPIDAGGVNKTQPCLPVHGHIPCVFYKGSAKVIVFFHGNAEDLETSSTFLEYVHKKTGYSMLSVEFEGYSIYAGTTSAQSIERDSLTVMRYLMKNGYDLRDISILGRSIGSGPAVYAASHYPIAALILISPFLSICKLVEQKYGVVCSMLLKQRFKNQNRMEHVYSPTLIVHGLEDTVIPYSHSMQLQRKAKGYCKVKLAEGMSHSEFSFLQDFIKPMRQFFQQIGFSHS